MYVIHGIEGIIEESSGAHERINTAKNSDANVYITGKMVIIFTVVNR